MPIMDLLRRFKQTTASFDALLSGRAVVVGVSGGADSLALLHLLVQTREALDLRPVAVHVDHAIRAESAEDARFVAETAAAWGVACEVARVDAVALATERSCSLEEAARLARYTVLAEAAEKIGATVIATGHHADDQAETVLMNLIRGAGLAGLRGMQTLSPLSDAHVLTPLHSELWLFRPLLSASRADIEAYCVEHGLSPRVDATNADTTYTRNRIRHEVLPLLERLNPEITATLARTASLLAGEYEIVQEALEPIWEVVVRQEDAERVTIDRASLIGQSSALQRALLRRAYAVLHGSLTNLGFEHIQAAVQIAKEGSVGAEVHLPGTRMRVDYETIHLERLEADLPQPDWPLLPEDNHVTLEGPGTFKLPGDWQITVSAYTGPRTGSEWQEVLADRWQAAIAAESPFPMTLRTRQPGERFQPMGAGGTQSLSDFMIDQKIPARWRDRLSLLIVQGEIAWVCGWRVDARFAVSPAARTAWLVRFTRQ